MRGVAIALATAIGLAGCAPTTPRHDRSHEVSYNRRELMPRPGVLTGPTGEWTLSRSKSPAAEAPPAAAPEAPKPEPTVLLPRETGRATDHE